MIATVDLEKWRGPRDETVLDPRAVEFKARPCRSCCGCIFDRQASSVCTAALEEADKRGLPHCEDGFVFVLVEHDPRQLPIEGA
jgi:hypothetical protein